MGNEIKTEQTNNVNENVPGTDTGAGQITPSVVVEKSDNPDEGASGTENKGTEQKPKQDSAKNSEFARRRRAEQEEKIKKETRINTIKELVGTNPWTNEAIENEYDVDMYLRMKAIEAEGGDPISDYAKKLGQEEKARRATKDNGAKDVSFDELTEEQKNERISNDFIDFQKKHPDVDVDALFGDKNFIDFAGEHLGKAPLSTLYSLYDKVSEGNNQKAAALEKQATIKAASEASVGALGTPGATSDTEFFTKEQVMKMSKEEISKNYEKIRRSQAKW